MKFADDMKRFFKNAAIETNPTKDREVLERVLEACEGAMGTERVVEGSVWMMRSPITKVAAVAVVIIAIGLLIFHTGPDKQDGAVKVSGATQSPAELTTLASLSFAYRRGGMEAVEEIFDKVFEMAGPQPAKISIRELLEESNGT
jgi:hypothetical protein